MQLASEQISHSRFFNFNHWPSFIATNHQVWLSKAYNAKTEILPQNKLLSNSIFYPLAPTLQDDEHIIQTAGGLFNFFYLTNQGRIFQIGHNHSHENLEFLPVPLPSDLAPDEKITQMVVKETASVVISNLQKIYVLGQNKNGELGLSHPNEIPQFTRIPLQLNHNESIIKLVMSNKDSLILSDDFSNYHSAFYTSENRLFVCGSNNFKQLGFEQLYPSTQFEDSKLVLNDDSIQDIALTNRATFILTSSGKLWVSGSYLYATQNQSIYTNHVFMRCPLPKLKPNEQLIQIETGNEHCILLTNIGRVLVSGKNSYGELGLGHRLPQIGFVFTNPLLLKNEKIIKISCINHQSVLETNAGRILFSGHFHDFTNTTNHKDSAVFSNLFYPREIYESQLKISRILLCLSIASYTGAIFTSQILHATFLVAGTSLLLPAIYIYLLSKHHEILHICEKNQVEEINHNLHLNL